MTVATSRAMSILGQFVAEAVPPEMARARAATAMLDTVGVTVAGAGEPASCIVQCFVAGDGAQTCCVLGTRIRASASGAALANGTAAHALDYDDMCFVSLAHPSAPLVATVLAAGELVRAPGRALLDAYIVGFEIEARLGLIMNPRHYQRGWHCTSTLGTIGTTAAASRLLELNATETGHALAIAASEASGLKENFGTMVKPLHAGLAARNGVAAAQLARGGLTASELAIDGPQGLLNAMDSQSSALGEVTADLGTRWEIVDTGICVKLYPSCAGTHPTLDALLELRRHEAFSADDVDRIDVAVDSITPTVLIYERPTTGLEAKFSMPFCAAAAVAYGRVGIDTFEAERVQDPIVRALLPRVAMHVDPALDNDAPPLTQAHVSVHLRSGRVLTMAANGARGSPDRPATNEELEAKFVACARRSISEASAERALTMLRRFETLEDVRELLASLEA
jgi:2-methylcitrate dehydratase PrpD